MVLEWSPIHITHHSQVCLLVQGFGWKLKFAHRDGVYSIERDPDDLLTQQVDEVVLAHQQ